MIQRITLGLIGGSLIAMSVFLDEDSFAVTSAPSSGASWALLVAGATAAVFSLFGVRTLMAFAAGAAAAVTGAEIVDMARANAFQLSPQLVVVTVGVLATIAAMIGPRAPRVEVVVEEGDEASDRAKESEATVVARPRPSESSTSTDGASDQVPAKRPEPARAKGTDELPETHTTSTGSIPVSTRA